MRSWWAAAPSTSATVKGSGATTSVVEHLGRPDPLHLRLVEQGQRPLAGLVPGPFAGAAGTLSSGTAGPG